MEKITYQISSRAAILLGRESVSKVDGAIIELIKNTYDADASLCILTFDIEHNTIYIIDNGTGMTKDIIQNCWMLIGTDNKRIEYQLKQDKRKRKVADLYLIIKNLELILLPLLEQKHIKLTVIGERGIAIKKVFSIDIESIICNLIINSIEAFKKIKQDERSISINISLDDNYIKIIYSDNGPGISQNYKDPYDIFNFGVTDKKDKNTGETIGTGLGMYIVATTINEYNGKYSILNIKEGFMLEILIPKERDMNGNT